jgi:hypothetical protein
MDILSIKAARHYIEIGYLILKHCDCVVSEDILSEINQLDKIMEELNERH